MKTNDMSSSTRKQNYCISCGADNAALRRCTNERLCNECRRAPEYKILTRPQIIAAANISIEELKDLQVGTVPNPVDKRLRGVAVFLWKDVMLRLLELGREIPEDEDWNTAWRGSGGDKFQQ